MKKWFSEILLENLKILKYPKELYDIYVIADNCTDSTAEVAHRHGAYVLERCNKELGGKGYAMDWAFPKIFEIGRHYDAFCVFDADNLVHLDFLAVMNTRLMKGQKVLQGYLSAKIRWILGYRVLLRLLSGLSIICGILESII